jgi:ferrochelatase
MRRPAAVRRYLKQFLSDPRVVEIPRAVWWFILNLIILPFRSGQSAKKYESIWTREGSPLRTHTAAQAHLRGALGERGHQDLSVEMAMRYGSPSLPEVLAKLKAEGAERILVLPAYPQYSGTTTGSIYDAVFQHYGTVRNIPSCASCATTTTTKAISAPCSNPCSTTGNSTASRKSW